MSDDPAKGGEPSPFSMRRVIPAPWVDCDNCGWRHYPDTSVRAGAQIPTTCASCSHALTAPDDSTVSTP